MKVREHRDSLISRVRILELGVLGCLALIAGAYWVVQIVNGPRYRELAENNRLRKVPIRAPRGVIADRNGRVLVENVPSYNLMIDRSRVTDLDVSLAFAAGVLGRPAVELAAVLERYPGVPEFSPVLLAEGLSLSQVARFGVAAREHPEFEVEVSQLRLYRQGAHGAHLLGYLSEVNAEDLAAAKGLRPGDFIGRRGVERAYDPRLRGEHGERVVVVDSRGRVADEFGRTSARPGRDLNLTLDLELQQEAERYFADKVGAAVALDPRTGQVLALVSSPAYNPNLFARRLVQTEWRRLLEDPFHPLQNRAIQNTYSPGSVFKVVMAVAGLAEGVVDEGTTVYCGGSARFYNRRFRCWKQGGHGRVALHDALKHSCDVYFYTMGQRLGVERIARWARAFGLGEPTGIDLASEKAGLVPDSNWSAEVRGHPWYPGETISVAIGQGPLLVTPLQMAVMMAAVANGGFRVTPHLAVGERAAAPRPIGVSAEVLAPVRAALAAVVASGTGAQARIAGLDAAGKTGTAQVIAQKSRTDSRTLPYEQRDHAWFVSFAPVEGSELVVVVFVEHGGKGSSAAAPLAKALYEIYFEDRLRGIQPAG